MQQRRPDPHEPPRSPRFQLARRYGVAFGRLPRRNARVGMLRRRAHTAERENEMEARLRFAARQSHVAAPPSLTTAVRRSLAQAEISSDPDPTPVRHLMVWHLVQPASVLGAATTRSGHGVWARHPRLALTGAGTLVVALLCGVGCALDPNEGPAAVGLAGAILLSALALAHLLSIAVGAILGDALLAGLAALVYLGLIVLWVQLVRRPVEA